MSRPSRSRVAVATGLSLGAAAAGLLFAPAAMAAGSDLPALTLSSSTVVDGGTVTVKGIGCLPFDDPADEIVGVVAALDVDPMSEEVDESKVALTDVAADGSWSVTFAVTGVGAHTVDAVCLHYVAAVDPYATASVTATAKTAAPRTSTPATATASVDPVTVPNTPGTAQKSGSTTGSVAPGAKIVKVIAGFKPREEVTLTLHSDPVVLGTFTADANGVVTAEFTLPAGTPVGDHHLVFEGAQGTHYVAALTVAAATNTVASASELAYTGADIAVPLVGGLVLVAAGAGAVVVGRRRKPEAPQV